MYSKTKKEKKTFENFQFRIFKPNNNQNEICTFQVLQIKSNQFVHYIASILFIYSFYFQSKAINNYYFENFKKKKNEMKNFFLLAWTRNLVIY